AAKRLAKLLVLQASHPFQRGVAQFRARLERGVRRDWRLVIPRADILADVAPENVATHPCPEVIRHGAALLDRQVGNAAAAVQLIRTNERVRRTGIEAARTTAAAVRRRQIRFEL